MFGLSVSGCGRRYNDGQGKITNTTAEALRTRFALGNDHLSGKFTLYTISPLIVMSR